MYNVDDDGGCAGSGGVGWMDVAMMEEEVLG